MFKRFPLLTFHEATLDWLGHIVVALNTNVAVEVTRKRTLGCFDKGDVLKDIGRTTTNSRHICEDSATITVVFDFVKCRSARDCQTASWTTSATG